MIEINNLYKIYNQNKQNEFCALKDINLTINDEEIIILKGVSGSGKSTLLSLIGAISKPSSGEILIDKKNISKSNDIVSSNYRHKNIGFIFQSFNLLENLSVQQNILLPLSLLNFNKSKLDEKIYQAMEFAKISHKKDQKVFNLSGGEKQRVAIARALVMDAKIILADEPTANLDKENSLNFINILKNFKKLKKTVIVATHDLLFDDLDFASRYLHLENGILK